MNRTMQGLWLEDKQLTLRSDIPIPEPQPGEAQLRMRLAGVCGTDLEMVRGYYPFTGVLGHEFVAEVVQSNSISIPSLANQLFKPGERVVGEINIVCGACEQCKAGRSTHCENRATLGIHSRMGVFTEYFTLPLGNLHRVPENVPDEAAVFTEPLAAALEIQEQVTIHPTDRVLLIGAGRLGQLIAQVLALTPCRLEVVVRRPQQAALLQERGISTVPAEEVQAGRSDIVVEATGSASGLDLALHAIRPRGVLVMKSTYAGRVDFNFSDLVVRELTFVGSRCGPFEPALRLMEKGLVAPQALVQQRFPLSQGLAAFECAAAPGMLKVLLKSG
jgi:threonine dehydrogenase-like Zn-dependent dehydrogenase